MATFLDYLKGLFIGDPTAGNGLPQMPGASGVQLPAEAIDPGKVTLGPIPGMDGPAPTQAQPQPQAPSMTLPDPAAAPQFRANGLPQRAPTAAADAPPAPPVKPVHGSFVNFLDRNLLGGAITAHDAQALGQQQAQYQYGQMRQFSDNLPSDDLRRAFWADPTGFLSTWEGNLKNVQLKDGETNFNPATSATTSAPHFDDKSGKFVQAQPGGGMVQSPSAGGDFKAENGVVVSSRDGAVANKYALPQVLAPGSHIGAFTPGVTGSLPQLPQAQAPAATAAPVPAPTGVPTPAQLPTVLPGARLTSGFRSPQHNLDVGGVPNSWHTVGTPEAPGALDLVPPPGVPMAQFAANVAARLPQLRVIPEGNHVHAEPKARNIGQGLPQQGQGGPQIDGTGSIIDNGPAQGPLWSAPTWNSATNRYEQTNTATNEVRDAGAGTFNPETLRKSVLDHENYKQATAAMTAYKAMVGNADKMTGPSAYSMLDTFARAINPGAVARPQVIQTIEANLGLPAQVVGGLDSKMGKGNLPPETRQQILDAVVKFAQAHWDDANSLNQSNASVAKRLQMDPANVVAPLDARPSAAHVTALPPKNQLRTGEIYQTGKGMAVWNGAAFTPYGR